MDVDSSDAQTEISNDSEKFFVLIHQTRHVGYSFSEMTQYKFNQSPNFDKVTKITRLNLYGQNAGRK